MVISKVIICMYVITFVYMYTVCVSVYSMYIQHSVNPSRSVSGEVNGQRKHVNMNTVVQRSSA